MAGLSFDDLIPAKSGPDYGSAISSIESGGRYDILGPATKTGDRAHGKYQVMGANIGPWTKEALGRELTPQEFLADKDAQEAVFKTKFGQYAEKYGPEGAAKAWFAGEKGMNNPDAKDVLGTSVSAYADKFNKALGPTDVSARAKPKAELSFDDLIPEAKPAEAAPPASFGERFAGDGTSPGLTQQQPSSVPAFIRDVPKEIADEAKSGAADVAALSGRGGMGAVEGLLSLPKAALGAARVALSPLTGTARSVLGHPIADAETFVGGLINPEVAKQREQSGAAYTDAKASVDTAMAAGMPGKAKVAAPVAAPTLREGQEAAAAAQRVGVDLPRAVTSDTMGVQQIGKIAANVPIAGNSLRRASQTAIGQMDEAMTAARTGFGAGDAATAGQVVREGITDAIKSGPIKERVNKLYDKVDALVDPTITAPMPNTRNLANTLVSRRTNAALPGSKNVAELEEALSRPGMNYEGIKDLRSYFGELLDGSKEIPQGMSKGEVKQIYGALSQDMKLVIARAGGKDGLAAYGQAEKAAARWATVRKDLQRVLNVQNEEGVFAKIVSAASSRSSADLQLLGRVRGAVGSDKWNEVSSAVIEKLGRAPDGAFSPDRLLGPSGLGGLSEAGKKILFRSTGNMSHADTIDDIATIAKRWKSLNQFANPSGTGQTTIGGALGYGIFADPVTAVSSFVGAGMTAKILSTPSSAKAMANWAKAHAAAAAKPTPANNQAVERASKLFAASISTNAGAQIINLDAARLARQLGTIPAAAENEQ